MFTSYTKNLNYSGTQAILLFLSFSHPPPRCRGFNPVMNVSGSLPRPCLRAAGSSPWPGGRATAAGDPWRFIPPPRGREGPGCRSGVSASLSSVHKDVGTSPGAARGRGLMPEGVFSRERGGSVAAAPSSILCRLGATPAFSSAHRTAAIQQHTTQHNVVPPSPSQQTKLPGAPVTKNSWTSWSMRKQP